MSKTSYHASINKRFVAALIDGILLLFLFFIACGRTPDIENDFPGFIIYNILRSLISWIYFAGMESSGLQATFGKKVLGIVVTNTNGNKISFGKATGRYFAKSIFILVWIVAFIIGVMASMEGDNSFYWGVAGLLFIIGLLLFFIGYIMAAFTTEKQALHDIIARCLV
ncbi:MAG: RDD family protein, partial [Spirulinaceae cyanobacterium]